MDIETLKTNIETLKKNIENVEQIIFDYDACQSDVSKKILAAAISKYAVNLNIQNTTEA